MNGTTATAPPFDPYIPELDGLRGIAILFVLLHHFWPEGGPLGWLHPLAQEGWVGVDLFFVVSGFLIAGILLDTRGRANYYRSFYTRRALRIFPLYYLFLALAFSLLPFLQGGPYFETSFVREAGSPLWYVLYLANLYDVRYGWPHYTVGPLWSLSIEEQFYLVFPSVVAVLSARRLAMFLGCLVLAAPAYRLATLLAYPDNPILQFVATPARMDALALGCLLALGLRQGWLEGARRWGGWAAAGAVLVLTVVMVSGRLDRWGTFGRVGGYSLVGVTFAAVLLWVVLNRGRARVGFLRFGPLTYLGKRCYGLYLLHVPAAWLLVKGLSVWGVKPNLDAVWFLAARLGSAVVLAMLSWAFVEQAFLRLKTHFARPGNESGPTDPPLQSAPAEA